MTFASRLFAWRQHRGLTQAVLAQRAGIPQSAVAALESGHLRAGLRRLTALERALDLGPGDLLAKDPPRPSWDRFAVDRLCRSLVAGRRGDSGVDEAAWLDLEALFRTRLSLANPLRRFVSRGRPSFARRRLDARWGREQVNLLDQRLRKWNGGTREAV